MRLFVWVQVGRCRNTATEELPDGLSEDEIEEAGAETIGNLYEGGWDVVEDEEEP